MAKREEGRMLVNHIKRYLVAGLFASLLVSLCTEPVSSEPGFASHLRQVAPLRQESVKMPDPAGLPKESSPQIMTAAPPVAPAGTEVASDPYQPRVGGYDPAGRRDPFAPILSQLAPGQVDPTLPPLQRVGLTDMNLIAIIWGGYGYTAMVQTPDGNGYTVRKGTRVGPNAGVVSAVTEKGIIVQERFTDVYGRKQEREYVKLLHPKEGLE
jgi:type IV pilus assembly protein PilP